MRKTVLLLSSVLVIIMGVGAQEIKVNTTSEWKDGTFNKVRAAGDKVFLRSEVPSEDWSNNNFDCPVSDLGIVEDYIYASSGNLTCNGHITKLDKSDGSIIWQEQKSGSDNRWLGLDMGSDGYVYVSEENEGVYRVDDSGNFNPTGTFPSGGLNYGPNDERDYDLEENDGVVYLVDARIGKLDFTSFYTSNASQKWHKNFSDFSREIDIYGNNLYLGDIQGKAGSEAIYRLDPSDGSIKSTTDDSSLGGSLDAIGKGPDGNLWVGHNDGVSVFTPDLNTVICSNYNYDHEVPAIAHDGSGVFSATTPLGRFNKMDGNCNLVWEEDPAPEAYETLKTEGRSLYAGADRSAKVSGTQGAIQKFFKEYDSQGEYVSKKFNVGSTAYLDQAKVNLSLNGEKANLTLKWSESGGFAPPQTTTEEYELNDGLNTFDLTNEDFQAMNFRLDLRSPSTTDTPRVKWVNISYSNSPFNQPPQISNEKPPDGSTREGEWQVVNATVEDTDADNINISVWDEDGNLLNNTNFTSGGPGKIKANYTGLHTGYNQWKVNVSDGFTTTEKTFEFLVPGEPPVIGNETPTDGSTAFFSPVDLAVDVNDSDADPLYVNISDEKGNLISEEPIVTPKDKVEGDYSGLTVGNNYEWQVNVSDGIHHVNDTFSFYYDSINTDRIRTSFLTNYSSVIASTSNQQIIPFLVKTNVGTRNIRMSFSGSSDLKPSFEDGSTQKELTVDENGTSVLLKVDPSSTGEKTLTVETRDQTIGVSNRNEIDVFVRETPPTFQRNNVPGIGVLNLLAITVLGSLAYFVSL